jgi:uncharacterized protein (TIGR03000 family)
MTVRLPLRCLFVLALIALTTPAPAQQAPAQQAQPATLTVRLPADARLTVEGQVTKQTGAERRFVSPPLEPGQKFSYTVSAFWEPNNYTKITRTRKVSVQAGKEVEVDLTKADPKQPDDIVIRYVPTPPDIVEAMLKLGKVGKDDVVYDLGCGDGRIVVAAVGKFKAKRGVGVDLDPQRIKESKANAERAGVTDKVEFRQDDIFKVADLDSATVVMLYMGNELNAQLRPILQKKLKPGTRIVSHRFTMGDWKPDKTETITGEDGDTYLIHLWTIGK